MNLTKSLSLTTISSMYLVSVWTEGLRTDLLDLLSFADACCCLVSGGLSSSASPPLRSHSLSSVQSGHRQEQSCSHLGTFPFQNQLQCTDSLPNSHLLIIKCPHPGYIERDYRENLNFTGVQSKLKMDLSTWTARGKSNIRHPMDQVCAVLRGDT